MVKNEEYLNCFRTLGDNWEVTDEQKATLEEYICSLYSSNKKYVNEARMDIFMKKQKSKNQIVDLSILPPCGSSLMLHIHRANYVARIWKLSSASQIAAPSFSGYGWNEDGSICWVEEQYPEDITDLLLNCDEEE